MIAKISRGTNIVRLVRYLFGPGTSTSTSLSPWSERTAKVASVWQDRVTMSRVCAEIETLYGLTATHATRGPGLPGVTRAE